MPDRLLVAAVAVVVLVGKGVAGVADVLVVSEGRTGVDLVTEPKVLERGIPACAGVDVAAVVVLEEVGAAFGVAARIDLRVGPRGGLATSALDAVAGLDPVNGTRFVKDPVKKL